jgi:hypothetical protein
MVLAVVAGTGVAYRLNAVPLCCKALFRGLVKA